MKSEIIHICNVIVSIFNFYSLIKTLYFLNHQPIICLCKVVGLSSFKILFIILNGGSTHMALSPISGRIANYTQLERNVYLCLHK